MSQYHREIVDDLEQITGAEVKTVVLLAAGNGWCDYQSGKLLEPGISQDEQVYRYVERDLNAAGYGEVMQLAQRRYRRRHGMVASGRHFLLPECIATRYQLIDLEV